MSPMCTKCQTQALALLAIFVMCTAGCSKPSRPAEPPPDDGEESQSSPDPGQAPASQSGAPLPNGRGETPWGSDGAFILPTSDKDQHGNPVAKRDGRQYDPKTGHPFEAWLRDPRMEFVFVPAGEFTMGSPAHEKDRDDDEGPAHTVRITKPFYLAKYEITQGQWRAAMGASPWARKQSVRRDAGAPAVHVSWADCQEFLKKLNRTAGPGFRLPTEAEWEYACRAGSTTTYSFGDDAIRLKDYAWYDGNAWDAGEKYAHAAGLKRPNAWGLYDMHGNVWEWCHDWYNSYAPGAQTDPVGALRLVFRVLRGGSFSNAAGWCRSAFRYRYSPTSRGSNLGARPARSLP